MGLDNANYKRKKKHTEYRLWNNHQTEKHGRKLKLSIILNTLSLFKWFLKFLYLNR